MPFISVTRLRLRSVWFLPRFLWHAVPSRTQAQMAAGNLGVDVLNDTRFTFWTKSAWESEAAMRAYLGSGAHKRSMPALQGIVCEAATTHWEQETAELPTWGEGYRRLSQGARFIPLRHPSANHKEHRVAPPKG